jgi:hypothetical protein
MQNSLSRVDLRAWYLTCHISWCGILDNKKRGELVWIDGGTKPKHSPVFPFFFSFPFSDGEAGVRKTAVSMIVWSVKDL